MTLKNDHWSAKRFEQGRRKRRVWLMIGMVAAHCRAVMSESQYASNGLMFSSIRLRNLENWRWNVAAKSRFHIIGSIVSQFTNQRGGSRVACTP